MEKDFSSHLTRVGSLILWKVERADEGLGLGGAQLEYALERLWTSVDHTKVRVEQRNVWCGIGEREKKGRGTYTRTPLLKAFLGSWTTPLMTTFSILNTESTVAAKMNMMDCASCAPGHAL
jgi:hypothetical protein